MTGHRETLPVSLIAALDLLGAEPTAREVNGTVIRRVLDEIDQLSPFAVPQAQQSFGRHARMYQYDRIEARTLGVLPRGFRFRLLLLSWRISWILRPRPEPLPPPPPRNAGTIDLARLARQPELAAIFLYHANGFVREAALRALPLAPVSAFVFASIVYRTNDWVANVRREATDTLARIAPALSVQAIVAAAPFLVHNSGEWGRSQDAHASVDAILNRSETFEELVTLVESGPPRGSAALMHVLLRNPAIDASLPRLALKARAPYVRAAASEALITGRARSPTGWRYYWIDKTTGHKGRERVFAERVIASPPPASVALLQAARDKAATVRKVVADAMIRGLDDDNLLHQLIALLRDDPNRGVRERVAFVLRRAEEANPAGAGPPYP